MESGDRPYLRILDGSGSYMTKEMIYDDTGNYVDFPYLNLALSSGTYYLKLDSNHYYYPTSAYSVAWDTSDVSSLTSDASPACPDSYEDNDVLETATALPQGEIQAHTIHDGDDLDYIEIVIP